MRSAMRDVLEYVWEHIWALWAFTALSHLAVGHFHLAMLTGYIALLLLERRER